MKATILDMVRANHVPLTATIHVEQENPRQLYFRNVLSSLSFVKYGPQADDL
jgi:hypothetical protein